MVIRELGNTEKIALSVEDIRALLEHRERVDAAGVAQEEAEHRADKAELRIEFLERKNRLLQHQLELLVKKLYGRSSEKTDPNQLLMFLNGQEPDSSDEEETPQLPVIGHTRRPKGHGRDRFPDHLPRKQTALEPDENQRVCALCGDPLCRVSEQISEKGEYIPGHWVINQYVRGMWACEKGHGGIVMAEAPPGVVDKSRFEPSVYAHVATAKYADHLPLHRQEGIFQRVGMSISRSTMSDMMRDLAILLTVIQQEMKRQLLMSHFIQTDDTPVGVLVEREGPKRKRKKVKGRIWVYIAPGGIVVFDFTLSWSRDGPASFLRGFEGTHLQGDKYSGYDHICKKDGLIKVGCWSHVRRKFVDAENVDRRRSALLVWLINWLFRIDRLIKRRLEQDDSYDTEQAHAARQRLARKVLARIKIKLDEFQHSPDVLPAEALGVAVRYALNQWDALEHYLDHLDISPDNNASERALRAVVLGRKNYLFFGSPKGGDTAATLYSLIATCKALELDPYAYLLDITRRLVADRNTPAVELTPWAWRDARAERVTAEVVADTRAEAADALTCV